MEFIGSMLSKTAGAISLISCADGEPDPEYSGTATITVKSIDLINLGGQ